ncbi:hypothetical protein [Limnospira platensis]|uniref:hypothetical protein n=1 Tax=Limnospira platensis TaxID=118562 RepID=UPI0001D0E70B|nr:hypothetical protein AP9108_01175 [Arthrospira sp. PCC 9108]BAI88124.1 hypothetical protein NIES39_A02850 [Arthrospira platensis NIES-39]
MKIEQFIVGWVERSRNPTHSDSRLAVVEFLWGLLGSHNLLLMRSLSVHITY